MTCTAEVTFGENADRWSCGGGTDVAAKHGILGMGASESDRGDRTMTIEVGTAAESVVIETATGYTIVIRPAGGIAYAAWKQHPPSPGSGLPQRRYDRRRSRWSVM